jgi:hypothetical protein
MRAPSARGGRRELAAGIGLPVARYATQPGHPEVIALRDSATGVQPHVCSFDAIPEWPPPTFLNRGALAKRHAIPPADSAQTTGAAPIHIRPLAVAATDTGGGRWCLAAGIKMREALWLPQRGHPEVIAPAQLRHGRAGTWLRRHCANHGRGRPPRGAHPHPPAGGRGDGPRAAGAAERAASIGCEAPAMLLGCGLRRYEVVALAGPGSGAGLPAARDDELVINVSDVEKTQV